MDAKKQLTIEKVDDYHYTIPRSEGMRVLGLIYANQKLLDDIKLDESPRQVANAAHLPGIIKYSLAMPDMHWGYGFPIGGVQPLTGMKVLFHPVVLDMISIVVAVSCEPI